MTDVTAATGINRWRLNDYLNRRRHITPNDLRLLASFLECDPEVIYE